MRLRAAVPGLFVVLLASSVGTSAAEPAPRREAVPPTALQAEDVDGDCHDDVPAEVELLPAAPHRVNLLLAVNSNVPRARGTELAGAVRRLYAPVGIDLRVTVRPVRVSGNDVRDLLDQVRTLLGGAAPRGVDVVHLVTAVDLTSQGQDSNIGLADCIGGIRDPKRAFSVSEISEAVRGSTLGPLTGSGDEEARTVAHEIGHLLGARHEHANCGQGAPTARPTDTPCTVMFPASPTSDVFGALEAAVVRGYARRYAG